MSKYMYIKMSGINDVTEFVKRATAVDGDIVVKRGKYCVDGKSLLGLFSLDLDEGVTVEYPTDADAFEQYIEQFASE